jgi:molybdenum cofactor cytidylyltransferase
VTAIVVVAAPFGDAVAAEATRLGCLPVTNPAPERGMASSVAAGFAALSAHAPDACKAAWLWPVDHPAVTSATLAQLVDQLGSHAAVRPTFPGRGGHPPLVARSLWPALAACAGAPGGARSVLAATTTHDVAVDDAGVIRDVDTPADLEAR